MIRHTVVLLLLALMINIAHARPPQVLASIKPLQLIAQAIVAGVSDAEVLLPPYADPHNYALKPSDLARLQRADLLLWISPEFEYYLAKPLSAQRVRNKQALAKLPPLSQLLSIEHAPDQDYHLWLSPRFAVRIANQLAWALMAMDSPNRTAYQDNLEGFIKGLAEVDEHAAQKLRPLNTVNYLVYHNAYRYFEQDYGISASAEIVSHDHRQLGAKRILELREHVIEQQVVCVLSGPDSQTKVIDLIIDGLPVNQVVFDPLASQTVVDELGYISLIRELSDNIADCLSRSQQ